MSLDDIGWGILATGKIAHSFAADLALVPGTHVAAVGSRRQESADRFAAEYGGTAHGYLATPPGGSGPGVIVIQEWWGLTEHIADVADRLAAEGFVALAPDLFGGRVVDVRDAKP